MRYDARWRRGGSYDDYRRWVERAYDGFARADESWGHRGSVGESEPGGRYGPARYGLGPYWERLQQRRRPDDELKAAVEETLFYDTWVDAEAIEVDVAEGVVTLRGTLPAFEEVRYATDDAWDVDGVVGVRSELEVDEG